MLKRDLWLRVAVIVGSLTAMVSLTPSLSKCESYSVDGVHSSVLRGSFPFLLPISLAHLP